MTDRSHQKNDITKMPTAATNSFRGSSATWKQRKMFVNNGGRVVAGVGTRPSAMLAPRSGWRARNVGSRRGEWSAAGRGRLYPPPPARQSDPAGGIRGGGK